MGIQVTCQDCSRTYNFKSELRGKKGRCRDCNGIIVIDDVDDLEDLLDEPEEDDFDFPEAPVRRNRKKRRRGSEMGQFWQALSTNEQLQGVL